MSDWTPLSSWNLRMKTELVSNRLRLRPCGPADLDAVFEAEAESLDELRRWFWWCHPGHSRERCAAWAASRPAVWQKGEEYAFVVLESESGELLGCAWLNALDPRSRRASLGYWVRSRAAGQGIATAAAGLVARWGFEELGLQRIEIVVPVGNAVSQRVAEKLGAVCEGTARQRLRVGERALDALVYSLLPGQPPPLPEALPEIPPQVPCPGPAPAGEPRPVPPPGAQPPDLSVVIPVRDEEQSAGPLIARLRATLESMGLCYEVIFVTDVNRDRTLEVLRAAHQADARLKVLKLSGAQGQHVAIMAGIDASRGRAVVLMDGDLQDLPEDIPKLYDRLRQEFDVVYGVKEHKNESWIRNLLSRTFVGALNWLSDRRLDFSTSMFRILSQRAAEQLRRFGEADPCVPGLLTLIDLPTDRVPVASGTREAGTTKYSLGRQVNFALSILVSFSTKPLRMISLLGLVVAGMSFAYLAVTVVQALFGGIAVQGWATLVSLLTFFSGVQLLALGILGEYVGRIFLESKRRPRYIVEERIGDLAEPPRGT